MRAYFVIPFDYLICLLNKENGLRFIRLRLLPFSVNKDEYILNIGQFQTERNRHFLLLGEKTVSTNGYFAEHDRLSLNCISRKPKPTCSRKPVCCLLKCRFIF